MNTLTLTLAPNIDSVTSRGPRSFTLCPLLCWPTRYGVRLWVGLQNYNAFPLLYWLFNAESLAQSYCVE